MHQSSIRRLCFAFKRSTFFITFDIYKENIKFIVQNLWIQIYDKDSRSVYLGYLWFTTLTHNTDEKAVHESNHRQKGLKIKLFGVDRARLDR